MSYLLPSVQSQLLLHLERIEEQWTHNHRFDSFGQTTASGHRTPHRAHGIPGRTFRIKTAIENSVASASPLILRAAALPGIEQVAPELLNICGDVALQLGASSIDPSSGIGKTDDIFLNYFGVSGLDIFAAKDLSSARENYQKAFRSAWGAAPVLTSCGDNRQSLVEPDISLAQSIFAEGHATLISGFFNAIAAYLRSANGRPWILLEAIKKSSRLGGVLDPWLAGLLTQTGSPR